MNQREYDRKLAEAKAKLKSQIIIHLRSCCNDNYPNVAKMISNDVGRSNVEAKLFHICSTTGMSIQDALGLIDTEE